MPQVVLLESFIGTDEENKRYANPHGVIQWALHDPRSGKKVRQRIIDLSEQRAKELGDKQIVRVLSKSEIARVKEDPSGLSLDPRVLDKRNRENEELQELRKQNADLQRQLTEAGKPLAGATDKPAPASVDK